MTNENILTNKGLLNNEFFEKKVQRVFNKQNVKRKVRIKEWDTYTINDDRFIVCLTMANFGFVSELQAVVVDIEKKLIYKKCSRIFGKSKNAMLASNFKKGISDIRTKNANFRFEIKNGTRYLKGVFKKFYNSPTYVGDLEFDFKIHSEPEESAISAHKFKDNKTFIYSQKINDLDADGTVTVNGKSYTFDKDLTFASCLLARGVMPYKTGWLLSSMNTKTFDREMVAFNAARIAARGDVLQENVLYYNGKIEHIKHVTCNIRKGSFKYNYLGDWTFYSDDAKLELIFEPIFEIKRGLNLLFLKNRSRLICGFYSGKLKLDNGKEIEIRRALGFSEKTDNLW